MSPKHALDLLKSTFAEWNEDKAPQLGRGAPYYTVFSLAPLLVVVIAIAGLAFGQKAANGQIVGQIQGLVGQDAAQAIQGMVQNASRPSSGIVGTIVGLATLLLGASGVFGQLKASLNAIWDVEPKAGRGLLGMLKDRFVSFTMLFGVAFLLLVSLVLSSALAAFGGMLNSLLPGMPLLLGVFNLLISFAIVTLLFAMIYKVLPDAEVAWRDVWIGAAVTALLFAIGKEALGLYLGRSSYSSTYGAAASLAVILVWVYYAAQILFFSAEFTQVYAKQHGAFKPAPGAVAEKDAPEQLTEAAKGQAEPPRKKSPQPPSQAASTQAARSPESETKPERLDATSSSRKHVAVQKTVVRQASRLAGSRAAAALIAVVLGLTVGVLRLIASRGRI